MNPMASLMGMITGNAGQGAGSSRSFAPGGLRGLLGGSPAPSANAHMSDEDRTWTDYMATANKATAGMNRMPWVFNGFGDLPENPNDVMSWFFKQQQSQQAPAADPMTQQVMPQPQGAPQAAPQQYGFGNNQAPPPGAAGAQQTAGGAMLFGQDGRPMYMIGEGGQLRPLSNEEQDVHWMRQLQQMIGGSLGGDVGAQNNGMTGGGGNWSGGGGGWGGELGGGDGKDSGGGGGWGSGGGGASP